MEENAPRDPDRPEDNGEESSRAARPLRHQPGNQHPHRITNFYIDNILRPDFGRMREIGTLVRAGDSLKVTIQRQDQSKAAHPRQPGAEAADGPYPDTEAGRLDLMDGKAVLKTRGGPQNNSAKPMLWPAWVYCTRYSDRPSSGPRSRKTKKVPAPSREDKRPRTAFTEEQLQRLKAEFQGSRYLTEQRRRCLAQELHLNESQIKIWFQNKRAKIKKSSASKNSLALHLRAQGLYDHSTASSD